MNDHRSLRRRTTRIAASRTGMRTIRRHPLNSRPIQTSESATEIWGGRDRRPMRHLFTTVFRPVAPIG